MFDHQRIHQVARDNTVEPAPVWVLLLQPVLTTCLCSFVSLTENPLENEWYLHQVSGARLSCCAVPETAAGRSHPRSERSEPGWHGLPHVSHKCTHEHKGNSACLVLYEELANHHANHAKSYLNHKHIFIFFFFHVFCGMSSGRELIRTSGDSLRLLVAKTEARSSGRSSVTKC